MLILFSRQLKTYLIWSVGSFTALLPGPLVWSLYAAWPTPRIHMGAGQMYIFFLPVIHIGYSLLVYFGTGLLVIVASQREKT